MMPHLDAAYNLAHWLTRSDADARDVVQESCLRAFKYFESFAGENPRGWLLSIVRRTCYTWLKRNRSSDETVGLKEDDENAACHNATLLLSRHSLGRDPEMLLIEGRDMRRLRAVIAALPSGYREIIVLRELEELSYRDIAAILGVPIGTVMSRLARARGLLHHRWQRRDDREQ
jgi:RNA polymerase sigma-70 factor (ECF subfamily)